jgi:hypothetical protein
MPTAAQLSTVADYKVSARLQYLDKSLIFVGPRRGVLLVPGCTLFITHTHTRRTACEKYGQLVCFKADGTRDNYGIGHWVDW